VYLRSIGFVYPTLFAIVAEENFQRILLLTLDELERGKLPRSVYFPEKWDLRYSNGRLLPRRLMTVSFGPTLLNTLSYWNKGNVYSESFDPTSPEVITEGLFARFEAFLTRAATCNSIFSTTSSSKTPGF
jgi:hypothetical protein